MNDQEKLDLMEVVNQQKTFIMNYLNQLNLKVKNNEVSLLFSDGEVDEATIDQQVFANLWELQYEPSLVRVEFTLESSNESNLDLHRSMESLINQLISIESLDNPYASPNQSKTIEDNYNCFQQIKIEKQGVDCKVILIGALGYFS